MPWYLKWFKKASLINILWAIVRRVYGKVYADAVALAKLAEAQPGLKTGADKANWVLHGLWNKYDELKEWAWLGRLIVELAVGEAKNKFKFPKSLKDIF